MSFQFDSIGVVRSCFKEKFGTPRQPGLATHAHALIEIYPPYNREECFRGLEHFSHLWVCFVFHQNLGKTWQPTVRPPRLGGNEKIGVFASRSGFRPNPLGISVVPLRAIEHTPRATLLYVDGLDLIDGTPIVDIKPYVPYVDAVPDARAGYAPTPPAASLSVAFSAQASQECDAKAAQLNIPDLRALIIEILQSDPRPAYYTDRRNDKILGLRLYDFDLKWRVVDGCAEVLSLTAEQQSQGEE